MTFFSLIISHVILHFDPKLKDPKQATTNIPYLYRYSSGFESPSELPHSAILKL